jgi:hypothetical protein
MDSKSILRACVILRDAVRNDPAVTGLELAVSAEAVLVTTIAVDGAKQSAPVMGEAAAAKYARHGRPMERPTCQFRFPRLPGRTTSALDAPVAVLDFFQFP